MSEGRERLAKSETRSLAVKLTDLELRERGDELAAVIQNVNTEERRQTDQKTQMKARLTELQARQTQLAITISRREEDRDVTVDVWNDYAALKVETVRRDTGECIHRREMTQDELQRPLPV